MRRLRHQSGRLKLAELRQSGIRVARRKPAIRHSPARKSSKQRQGLLVGEKSDSLQQHRSLSWNPLNAVSPGTKASWSAKSHHSSRRTSGPSAFIYKTLIRSENVRDITHGNQILARAMVVQRKTQRPVQFELTEPTRTAVAAWIERAKLKPEQYLFPSRLSKSPHVSTRQYARIVHQWVSAIGLDSTVYGTHTMRRTKATLIYKRTKNLRAVQLLLGHSKLESTVRYLGIEVDDALEISEQTEI